MNDLSIPFTNYDHFLYDLNLCGDLLVLGLAVIETQSDAHLNEQLLKEVLKLMTKRHPYLRAHLEFDNTISFRIASDYTKIEIKDKDLLFIKLKSRDELEEKLAEFTKLKIDYKDKLWRLIVFSFKENEQNFYAINLWLPLFITDALNITSLLIEIVNILNSLIQNTKCTEMIEEFNTINNMMEITQRYNLVGEEQLKKIDEINNIQTSSFKFDPLFKNDTEKGCNISFFNFDKNKSDKLISLSKQNGVKFTAFVMNCFNYSFKPFS